jgi:hypothetical protein
VIDSPYKLASIRISISKNTVLYTFIWVLIIENRKSKKTASAHSSAECGLKVIEEVEVVGE